MKPNDIPIEVFENELIPYADRYFKKVIINSKNRVNKGNSRIRKKSYRITRNKTKVWNRICIIQQV